MEQRDYILREIEKIGAIIRAISQRLLGGTDRHAISIEKEMQEAKGMLINELNFDLDKFLSLNNTEAEHYIQQFEGFNIDIIEEMALLLSEIGFNESESSSKEYLEKALMLYNLCNQESKTFSFERDNKIKLLLDKLK